MAVSLPGNQQYPAYYTHINAHLTPVQTPGLYSTQQHQTGTTYIEQARIGIHAYNEVYRQLPHLKTLMDRNLNGVRGIRSQVRAENIHIGLVANLIFCIASGWTTRVQQRCPDGRSRGAKLIRMRDSNQFVYDHVVLPLVRYFVIFLNADLVLDEDQILQQNIESFQQSMTKRATRSGTWSVGGILAKTTRSADNKTLDGMMFPYAMLACRLIPGFSVGLRSAWLNGTNEGNLLPGELTDAIIWYKGRGSNFF